MINKNYKKNNAIFDFLNNILQYHILLIKINKNLDKVHKNLDNFIF